MKNKSHKILYNSMVYFNGNSNLLIISKQFYKGFDKICNVSDKIVSDSVKSVSVSTLSVTNRCEAVSVSKHSLTASHLIVTECEKTVTVSSHSVTNRFDSVTFINDTVTVIKETVTPSFNIVHLLPFLLISSEISLNFCRKIRNQISAKSIDYKLYYSISHQY